MTNDIDKFLETKKLTVKNPFEGYVIPYAYLKELIKEFSEAQVQIAIKNILGKRQTLVSEAEQEKFYALFKSIKDEISVDYQYKLQTAIKLTHKKYMQTLTNLLPANTD